MADVESDERHNEIDFAKPHSARVWDAMQGGKNNYDIDRAAAAEWIEIDPGVEPYAKASRPFIRRVVRYLAGEGIRQFLDIGTGLPADQNTHEIAQAFAPESRIVYVDDDPLVLTHARALLTNTTDEGVVSYIDADAHRPDEVISQARHILNLREPVAVMLMG
ncbi:MAG: SAM-dependent methyltransferase, partial [Actinobacteria bacterium]|nr:SAM-dependent methyltransferase [Actinomycetota bacterium]